MNLKSEIGECIYVLKHKRNWDETPYTRKQWKKKLHKLLSETHEIDPKNQIEPGIIGVDLGWWKPYPIPLEVEFNMPELDYETLFKAWKLTFK